MIDTLAAFVWFIIGMFVGVAPGVWLIVNDATIAGIAVVVGGYLLGGLAAEILVRIIERDRG